MLSRGDCRGHWLVSITLPQSYVLHSPCVASATQNQETGVSHMCGCLFLASSRCCATKIRKVVNSVDSEAPLGQS